MQRAFVELLKGNLWMSLKLYPALLPMIIMIFYLFLHLGFKFGIPVSSSFNQNSVITSPDYVVFKDTDSFKRNVDSGEEIPEVNGFHSSLALGAGYEFPSAKKLYIVPEVRYFLALNDINIDDFYDYLNSKNYAFDIDKLKRRKLFVWKDNGEDEIWKIYNCIISSI